jgi:exopolysaccharide biosynthesis protein
MALDGGSSSALYSNGQFITKPGRKLTNLILVYD